MPPRKRSTFLVLLPCLASFLAAETTYAVPPPLCPPGRFLLPDGATALVQGGAGIASDAIVLESTGATHTVAIDSGCAATAAKVKATRKGTKIRARWAVCGTDRKLKLAARIALDCTAVQVKLKVAGAKPRRAEASRSACGDSRVDAIGGEQCEADGDCEAPGTCAACQCLAPTTTSSTSTSSTAPPGTTTTTSTIPATSTTILPSTTTTTLPGPAGPSSYELIAAALAAAEIDAETAHKYRVFAAFNDSRLPAAYRGDDTRSGEPTSHLAAARAAFAAFSAETQADLAPFFRRPDEPGSWITLATVGGQAAATRALAAAVTWQTFSAAGGKVKVWAQDRYPGDAAKAQDVATALTARIWNKVAGVMTPPDPVSDAGLPNNGGDGALDVYLVHAPLDPNGEKDWLGFCDFADANNTCQQSPTFLLLDSEQPIGSETSSGMLQTCAHEIFHAFAAARTFSTGCLSPEYSWIDEASAIWIEDHAYPLAKSEHDYASEFLDYPRLSLDNPANEHEYGAYLFPFYLVRSAGLGGESIVGDMWDHFASQPSLQGINTALLIGTGTSFEDTWPLFTLHNWNSEPVRDYFQWDELATTVNFDGATLAAGTKLPLPLGLPYLTASHWDLFVEDDVGAVVLENPIADELSPGAAVWGIPRIDGQWQTPEDWTYELHPGWCRDFAGERLDELLLVFSNGDWMGKSTLDTSTPPVLYAFGVGCRPWEGIVSATLIYDGTAVLISTAIPVRFEPSQPQTALGDRIVSPLVSAGAGQWTASGTMGDCTVSGTIQLDPGTAVGFFNVYPKTDTYAGGAGAGPIGQQTFTMVCDGIEYPWLPDEGMGFFRTGFPDEFPVFTVPGGMPTAAGGWSGDACLAGQCVGTYTWSLQQLPPVS
jgi:hypothetical protein